MKIYQFGFPSSKRGWASRIRKPSRTVWSALKNLEVPVELLPGVAVVSFMTKPAKGADIVGGSGGLLFSERFRNLCLENAFSGIEFYPTALGSNSVAPVDGWYWARTTAGADIDTDLYLGNGQEICPVTKIIYTPEGLKYTPPTHRIVLSTDPPADFFGTANIHTNIIMFTEKVHKACLQAKIGGFIAEEIADSQ
jgi:hypothetical protein